MCLIQIYTTVAILEMGLRHCPAAGAPSTTTQVLPHPPTSEARHLAELAVVLVPTTNRRPVDAPVLRYPLHRPLDAGVMKRLVGPEQVLEPPHGVLLNRPLRPSGGHHQRREDEEDNDQENPPGMTTGWLRQHEYECLAGAGDVSSRAAPHNGSKSTEIPFLVHQTVKADQTTARRTAREYCSTKGRGPRAFGGVLVERGRDRGLE